MCFDQCKREVKVHPKGELEHNWDDNQFLGYDPRPSRSPRVGCPLNDSNGGKLETTGMK